MALTGLLRTEEGSAPRSVALEFDDDALVIHDPRGKTERLAHSDLIIRAESGTSVVIGRRWRRRFRLQLSGEAARYVCAMLPPPASLARRLGASALAHYKLAAALLVAPLILLDHLPGEWLASATPSSFAHRLEDRAIEQARSNSCDDAGGRAALGALVGELGQPANGPAEAVALPGSSFTVSARPGGQLLIYRSAISEVDAEVLAALIAHEMGHIDAGHALAAAAREEGSNYVLRILVPWWERELVAMSYTRDEERAADEAAIARLRRANISMRPAAEFFARVDKANLTERYWAQEYSSQHPGIPNRAAVWATAAGSQSGTRPPINERQADELFNICWERPAGVATKWSGTSDGSADAASLPRRTR